MPRAQAVEDHMQKRSLVSLAKSELAAEFKPIDFCVGNARKSLSPVAPPLLPSLDPMSIAELQPGNTHHGRVLHGKLIVPPYVLKGIITLLEDDAGSVVKLVVYNLNPPFNPSGRDVHAAQCELLPHHSLVAVIEPFFKLLADGTYGVRVDDPRELVLRSPMAPAAGAPHVQTPTPPSPPQSATSTAPPWMTAPPLKITPSRKDKHPVTNLNAQYTDSHDGSMRSAVASGAPLPAGTRVLVQGLVSKPEHNGKHGNVRFFTSRTGRYTVAFNDGLELALKPECVHLAQV